jgi:hypothetical protein
MLDRECKVETAAVTAVHFFLQHSYNSGRDQRGLYLNQQQPATNGHHMMGWPLARGQRHDMFGLIVRPGEMAVPILPP